MLARANRHTRHLLARLAPAGSGPEYHSIGGVFGSKPVTPASPAQPHPTDPLPPDYQLVKRAFQQRGHRLCQLDPLQPANQPVPCIERIEEESYLREVSRVLRVDLGRFLAQAASAERKEYLLSLFRLYCGHIGFEFDYLAEPGEVEWFEHTLAAQQHTPALGAHSSRDLARRREEICRSLLLTEALDHFLATKFPSVKRYGCEGAETMVTFVEEILALATRPDCPLEGVVIGMPHRGRLNLLLNSLHFPGEALFRKLAGQSEIDIEHGPGRHFATGDVLSHLHWHSRLPKQGQSGHLQVTLLPNPSHLEAVSPVVCGFARGKMLEGRSGPYGQSRGYPTLPLQIHGDASFSGQGVVMETLAMAEVDHYAVGGSIHLVLNNQVGYTTPGRRGQARSSLYCTDPAKAAHVPVIHVNGLQPELVVLAARLALQYRQTFARDIAVDLCCFRRWGHNELDDPSLTNPRMYSAIAATKSIPNTYAERIQMAPQSVTRLLAQYKQHLNQSLARAQEYRPPALPALTASEQSAWRGLEWPSHSHIHKWNTSVPESTLRQVAQMSTAPPTDFHLHATLRRVFADRLARLDSPSGFDWATAESLAFGSLLLDGFDVRLSGQDVGRGTFSQRHAMLVDQHSGDICIPLNQLCGRGERTGRLEICNSILSEEAVMGFEYGLSVVSPRTLAIWEAQFGDFFNGAQIMIDTLVSSGEAKWLLQSALTLLLPHGYDGAGPEHTSARLERFLQQSNSGETEVDSEKTNWSVAYPTTPAQYFHLLRRQMVRPFRKPLVVMSPKVLLRHPQCVSTLAELTDPVGHFAPVLDDPLHRQKGASEHESLLGPVSKVDSVKWVVFCSGKHFYSLSKERDSLAHQHSVAIVRLEQLCPFPAHELTRVMRTFPQAKRFIWSQEEHRNMGAWTFVEPRFRHILKCKLEYAGRGHLEAPAVGIGSLHQQEVASITRDTFALCK